MRSFYIRRCRITLRKAFQRVLDTLGDTVSMVTLGSNSLHENINLLLNHSQVYHNGEDPPPLSSSPIHYLRTSFLAPPLGSFVYVATGLPALSQSQHVRKRCGFPYFERMLMLVRMRFRFAILLPLFFFILICALLSSSVHTFCTGPMS